jgi:hypothetical protein
MVKKPAMAPTASNPARNEYGLAFVATVVADSRNGVGFTANVVNTTPPVTVPLFRQRKSETPLPTLPRPLAVASATFGTAERIIDKRLAASTGTTHKATSNAASINVYLYTFVLLSI